jgi:hypothetical protein
VLVIKPLEEDHTPGTVKPFQVSLVEPVAYLLSYHVQAAGAVATLVYTFSPTLINEASWGINRGQQGVQALTDTSADTATGGATTYAQSQLPLKDSSGNPLSLPRINPNSNILNLRRGNYCRLPHGRQDCGQPQIRRGLPLCPAGYF